MLARLMARVGLVTPEQRAWAWYDWANSVYFTTVITAVFPTFYSSYAAKGLEPAQATARFGLITTAIPYAMARGTRDFSSTMQLVAGRYDVLCDPQSAERGRDLLARLTI